jgi:hypothetical protein
VKGDARTPFARRTEIGAPDRQAVADGGYARIESAKRKHRLARRIGLRLRGVRQGEAERAQECCKKASTQNFSLSLLVRKP